MSPLLAILIPYTPDREQLLNRVLDQIRSQMKDHPVIVITNLDKGHKNGGKTTGEKRNELIHAGIDNDVTHFSFIDSDDGIGPTYIQRAVEFMNSGMDCAELFGQIYWSGKPGKPFHHYLECTHAWEDDKQYHRPPNHLNFWKLDKVKDFGFQNKVFGEDMTWAMEIKNSGTIKTMMPIPEIIYHYYVGNPKKAL